eukprot:CAMPEP_0172190874 /NCGR_PEP_ID=MMETSP1050-20130122/23364_1 /TAXON_ID=233186 /ORGANISM="Cryptomonas curvata, Strain CCAP979/52" /LENGTH=87 /DNA_ID=CAMNT_0012865813 /DNA_START=120 /DNA_END=379 /DNA_ORIENTATION=-
MSISLSSSSDDEKYINKDFLRDIDEKIAVSGGSRTLQPLSRREDSTPKSSSSSKPSSKPAALLATHSKGPAKAPLKPKKPAQATGKA